MSSTPIPNTSRNNSDTVKTFSPTLSNYSGEHPLVKAVQDGDLDNIKKYIIKYGSDILNKIVDSSGSPLIYIAVELSHKEIVRYMISQDVRTDKLNSIGLLPIHRACDLGADDMLEALLDRPGINISVLDNYGWSPLHYATRCESLACIKMLIRYSSDIVNLQTQDGSTALHVACHFHFFPAVKQLVASGADINIQSQVGWTPLIMASFEGQLDIVTELVMAGAKIDLRDDKGFSAIDYGKEKNHIKIVEFLQAELTRINAPTPGSEGYLIAQKAALLEEEQRLAWGCKSSIQRSSTGTCIVM